ncbi:MAG TPA: DnaJ domain-containing protein [Chloroflexota bacterium]|jgi:curved DNA-binding protein CbpA|nr:DnaJ domain-containing protein [Chloroflexota bacterium]
MLEAHDDPYAILSLQRDAAEAEIRQAYFALVRAHPPERDPETFKRIRAAYERLRDPEQRLEAGMRLPIRWPAPARQRRVSQLDLTVHAEDVIDAAQSLTDLARTDWHEQFRKVKV